MIARSIGAVVLIETLVIKRWWCFLACWIVELCWAPSFLGVIPVYMNGHEMQLVEEVLGGNGGSFSCLFHSSKPSLWSSLESWGRFYKLCSICKRDLEISSFRRWTVFKQVKWIVWVRGDLTTFYERGNVLYGPVWWTLSGIGHWVHVCSHWSIKHLFHSGVEKESCFSSW